MLPEPVLQTRHLTLYQGDALEVLAQLPSAGVDACVTDPPYGEGAASWDGARTRDWYLSWLREVDRVVVSGGPILTFAPRRKLDLVMAALREVRGDSARCPMQRVVWVHKQGFRLAPGYLRPEHEEVVVSGLVLAESDDARGLRRYGPRVRTARRLRPSRGFGPYRYVPHPAGPMAGTVIEAPRRKKGREATGHPTQKPEDVMRYLVALAAPVGATVLDPFAGSGTTLVVARAMGRRAIGIDRAADYCRLIVERCAQEALPWEPADG